LRFFPRIRVGTAIADDLSVRFRCQRPIFSPHLRRLRSEARGDDQPRSVWRVSQAPGRSHGRTTAIPIGWTLVTIAAVETLVCGAAALPVATPDRRLWRCLGKNSLVPRRFLCRRRDDVLFGEPWSIRCPLTHGEVSDSWSHACTGGGGRELERTKKCDGHPACHSVDLS
jgi:hypothetical protein